jgi:peptide/nickel transport system permease protein
MKQNPYLYLGKKLLVFLASIVILSLAVFYIARLVPGDPLMSYYGERVEKMSAAEKEAAREKLGLNDPIHIQYLRWVENAVKGDFGISYKYKQDVLTVIHQRLGNTLI